MPPYLIPQGIGTPSDIVSFLLLGLRNFISHAPALLEPFSYDVTDAAYSVDITDSARTVDLTASDRTVDITASDRTVEFADSITEVEL